MSFQKLEAVGVYPPNPTLNTKKHPFFEQAVFVPTDPNRNLPDIPVSLAFGEGVRVRSDRPFLSEASGRLETPFVVSGTDPKAVTARVQAVFQLPW